LALNSAEYRFLFPVIGFVLSSGRTKLSCLSGFRGPPQFDWVKKTEVDSGKRAGISTDVAEKMKALERENRELRQANEILRKASAYFAQAELDRPLKR
jgi:hypothetical protein